ncbi:MAG: hypothetical protein AAGK67_12180 [Pseudomonadota bacterium]
MQHSPHAMRLKRAVRTAYLRFGRRYVSRDLEVSLGPIDMTPEIRDQIVGTRNDALPVELIREYTNSTHGVPANLADLKVLLPRYLEIMAEDIAVDFAESGTELKRFGDALRSNSRFFTNEERAVLDDWASAMLEHFAMVDAKTMSIADPFYLFQALVLGGWSVPTLARSIESAFGAATTGPSAMRRFSGKVTENLFHHHGKVGVNWPAMRHSSHEAKTQAADWLNSLCNSPKMVAIAEANGEGSGPVKEFVLLSGRFSAELFPS